MEAKHAVVVGATSGIGLETARLLAAQGYRVNLIGRNQAVGNLLARELNGVFWSADMSLLGEVRRVAALVLAQVPVLDVIVHSADVLRVKREETSEGHEISFATNYLSRFLLNSLLLEALRRSAAPRIVHVAAAGIPVTLSYDKFPPGPTIGGFASHNLGQAANDFYGLEFAARYSEQGLRINVLNPGLVDTPIRRRGDGGTLLQGVVRVLEWLMRPATTRPEAYAQLVAAIAIGRHPAADQAVFLNPKGKPLPPRKDRLDADLRRYVWEQSERMVATSTTAGSLPQYT